MTPGEADRIAARIQATLSDLGTPLDPEQLARLRGVLTAKERPATRPAGDDSVVYHRHYMREYMREKRRRERESDRE